MDEIDQMLAQDTKPAASPRPSGAPPPATDEIDDLLASETAIDDLTGEDIPDAFGGSSPLTAMNKSPLSALDRFKLSLGNEAGNLDYLKKRFGEVAPIPGKDGKPSKEIAVRENGKWHRIDPINGEISDPWERAKEYASDAADLGPIGLAIGLPAAAVAAGASAPALATVGGAAAIGAGTAALRTSLGRIVGTYDATPAEQAWDIGFESLLNAAGTKVLAGVKPTAGWVAKRLGPLAEKFKDVVGDATPNAVKNGAEALANSPKAIFKNIMGGYSVGIDNFDTAVQHYPKVRALMESVEGMVGKGQPGLYHDRITEQQIGHVQEIAQNSRSMLSTIYGSMKNKILDKVDDNFSANLDDALHSTFTDALSKGFGKIQTPKGDLVGSEAAEYIAKNGIKGAKFSLLSQKEMANAVKAGAELGDDLGILASDPKAYAVVKDYYNSIGTFAGGEARTGKAAAKALLDFKKVSSELSYSFANSEKAQSVAGVKRIIDTSRVAIDKSIRSGLEQSGAGAQFDKLNATYSNLSKEFAPLLAANERYAASKDMKVYEGLLGGFLARPGKQVSKKMAVDAAIDAAEEYGLKGISHNLKNAKTMVQVGEAAKAFNPIKSGQVKADALGLGQAGMMMWAVQTGRPEIIVAAAGTQVLRSPTTAKAGIALTQSMFKGQQFLTKQTPQMLDKFLSDPKAMGMFTNAIIQAPIVREQAEAALNGQIQQAEQQ